MYLPLLLRFLSNLLLSEKEKEHLRKFQDSHLAEFYKTGKVLNYQYKDPYKSE